MVSQKLALQSISTRGAVMPSGKHVCASSRICSGVPGASADGHLLCLELRGSGNDRSSKEHRFFVIGALCRFLGLVGRKKLCLFLVSASACPRLFSAEGLRM